MRTFLNVIMLIIFVLFVISLTGCGSDDDTSQDNNNTITTEENKSNHLATWPLLAQNALGDKCIESAPNGISTEKLVDFCSCYLDLLCKNYDYEYYKANYEKVLDEIKPKMSQCEVYVK